MSVVMAERTVSSFELHITSQTAVYMGTHKEGRLQRTWTDT